MLELRESHGHRSEKEGKNSKEVEAERTKRHESTAEDSLSGKEEGFCHNSGKGLDAPDCHSPRAQ